jgi:hypothetical protein
MLTSSPSGAPSATRRTISQARKRRAVALLGGNRLTDLLGAAAADPQSHSVASTGFLKPVFFQKS